MPFAAFDLHKQHLEAILLNADGSIRLRQRLPTNRAALVQFAQQHLSPAIPLAVEATFNTWAIVDLLTPFVQKNRRQQPAPHPRHRRS